MAARCLACVAAAASVGTASGAWRRQVTSKAEAATVTTTSPTSGVLLVEREREAAFHSGVLLATAGMHADRLRTVERYRGFFWDVVYVCPTQDARDELQLAGVAFHSCQWRWVQLMGGGRADLFHMAYGEIASLLAKATPATWPTLKDSTGWSAPLRADGFEGLRGVLFAHTDFWLTPSFAQKFQFSFDDIWMLPPRCLAKEEAEKVIWWKKASGNLGNPKNLQLILGSAVETVATALQKMDKNPRGFCDGWTDMFYLPRRAWEAFGHWIPILQDMGLRNGHVEITGPLVLQYIARQPGGPAWQRLECWGSCCESSADPAMLQEHVCGHKMELRSDDMREAFEQTWDRHFRQRQRRLRAHRVAPRQHAAVKRSKAAAVPRKK